MNVLAVCLAVINITFALKAGLSDIARAIRENNDRFLLPLCRKHHDQFHDARDRKSFAFGWDEAKRLTFQEQECERLREVYRDLQELDVIQEPLAKAI